MEQKTWTPLAVGLFFAGFAVVSLAVIITRQHPYFVKKKLKIGALIFTLSGAMSGCIFETTCYAPVIPNELTLDQEVGHNRMISLTLPDSNRITGKIYNRKDSDYAFVITDQNDSVLQKEALLPNDGTFDEKTEEVQLEVDPNTAPGSYWLMFYDFHPDSIPHLDNCIYKCSLQIVLTNGSTL